MIDFFKTQIETSISDDPLLFYFIQEISYLKDSPSIALEMKTIQLSDISKLTELEFIRQTPNYDYTIPVFKIKQNLN